MPNTEGLEKFNNAPIQNSGKAIKEGKDPLDRWEGWESAPEFLVNYVKRENWGNFDMKSFMEQVIRELQMTKNEQAKYLRPDPVPFSYRENYQYLRENVPRLNVNPTGLTIEQILGQDRHFHRTYVDNNTFASILQRYGCTSYMSGKKWELKHHKLTNYGWPKFSHDFKSLGFINVGPEGIKDTGYGWGAAYEIPFTVVDMAAGGTFDPDYWSLFFLGQNMGIFGDERGWLGGAGRNTTGKGAPNLTGLCNDADKVSVTAPDAQLGYSSGKSDFDEGFADFLTSWHTNAVYESPVGNVLVSTPGHAAETTLHDSTYGNMKTLYQQLQDKWFRSGELSSWYISQNICSTALASMTKATQHMYAFKLGPSTVRRVVVYPLQRKILSEKFKTYPDDIAFAYITGDIIKVYDGNALLRGAAGVSASKCQHAGWRMSGLFMDADSQGQKAYVPPTR